MNAIDVIRRSHEHRIWANRHLRAAAAQLAPQSLRQPFAIGQGSIWKSLLHLYAAEYVWLESLLGDETPLTPGDVATKLPGNQEGTGAMTSLEQLEGEWSALDTRWQNYLANLEVAALDETVVKLVTAGKLAGRRLAARRVDVLLHVCTHAAYTTAQVVNMLRQLGVDAFPDVMLISLARQQMIEGG
ncbi:MAG TPA: DinB family protein [Pirellulales bacterium]|jgi:uncharacterized damage-inducible protein DinB|nr:DinB family protein [Pirellulales bacterium]